MDSEDIEKRKDIIDEGIEQDNVTEGFIDIKIDHNKLDDVSEQAKKAEKVDSKDKNDFRNMNLPEIIKRVAILTISVVVIFLSFYKTINVLGWCFESNKQLITSEEAYTFVHEMTNNVILPRDTEEWESIDINNKNIYKAMEYFSVKDSQVVKELKKWIDGDFDNSVDFHNYVWGKLYGDVGEAIAIDQVGVDSARFNLGY